MEYKVGQKVTLRNGLKATVVSLNGGAYPLMLVVHGEKLDYFLKLTKDGKLVDSLPNQYDIVNKVEFVEYRNVYQLNKGDFWFGSGFISEELAKKQSRSDSLGIICVRGELIF